MFKHEKVIFITRTAVLIAITVVLQALTLQLGNQFLTGSVVNMMLILSVMTSGITTGLVVSIFTPILPTLFGFGPVWPVVPFIAMGNMALVSAWHFIGNREIINRYVSYIIAMVAGAAGKFIVLYIGIVQLVMPFILGLPENHIMSVLFSWPQLVTAAIGGVCAMLVLPPLLKALKKDS